MAELVDMPGSRQHPPEKPYNAYHCSLMVKGCSLMVMDALRPLGPLAA
jgi:hypothetical protein